MGVRRRRKPNMGDSGINEIGDLGLQNVIPASRAF